MNTIELRRVLIRVATIAPHLTGGNRTLQREREETLLEHFGPTPTAEDTYQALRNLTRNGHGGNDLNWSTIVSETLAITRRRIGTHQPTNSPSRCPAVHGGTCICFTDPAFIPMPADFAQQVAYWRDRARQERAEKTGG